VFTLKRPRVTKPALFGPAIRFEIAPPSDESGFENPRWVQIARTGLFKGHPAAPQGVDMTREMFEQCIRNFRADPAYKPGPDGIGTEKVIPYDYEHASEMPATEGSIPQKGAPAPAWVLDLQLRAGDGVDELWAWTWFGATAAQQCQDKEYRWTSVAVWSNAIDPESGEEIGAYLSSVALTNHPFISGMAPITARAHVYQAESPEEAIIGLRDLFGLPADSDPQQVIAELTRFSEMLASGTVPEHIELDWFLANLRDLLGARILSTSQELVAEAIQKVATVSATTAPATTAPQESATMTTEKIPATVVVLSTKLSKLFGVRDSDEAILNAAQEGQSAVDAIDQLKKLFEAPDTAKVIEAAVNLVTKVSENSGLLETIANLKTQLAGAEKSLNEYEDAEALAEAEAVVASRVAPIKATADRKLAADTLRPVILAARRACIGDAKKLEEFRVEYKLPEEAYKALTSRIFAGPNGQQLGSPETTGAPTVPVTAPLPSGGATEGQPAGKLGMIATFSGNNNTERAIAYLSSKDQAFAALPFNTQCLKAGRWLSDESAV